MVDDALEGGLWPALGGAMGIAKISFGEGALPAML